MSIREEQCNKVCRILDDVLANRPTERDSLIVAVRKAFEQLGNSEQLPPAQPELQWIPCSERMPEEHAWIGTKKFGTTISDEVYVTFENEKGERFCKHLSFQNGELSRHDKLLMETWFKGSKPIAWMPLPKPFEGGIK